MINEIPNERSQKREIFWDYMAKAAEAKERNDIDAQIECLEKAVAIKCRMTQGYSELRKLYKKLRMPSDEERICRLAIEEFPDDYTYKKRLNELDKDAPDKVGPTKRMKQKPKREQTWGDMFFEKWNSLTKDDFYVEEYEADECDLCEDENTVIEPFIGLLMKEETKKVFYNLQEEWYHNEDFKKAKAAETENDYLKATELYERMAAERIPYSDYYGHIAIYKKFRLREAELESILELQEICNQDNERYAMLRKRFAEWFPETAFAKNGRGIENIAFPENLRISVQLIRRIDWLRDKIMNR